MKKQVEGKRKKAKRKELGVFEVVEVVSVEGKVYELPVKVDTGAYRTSVCVTLAEKLGWWREENVVSKMRVWGSFGREERPVVKIRFRLKGRTIRTTASVAKRSHMRYQMIVGRSDLKGFVVVRNKPMRLEERKALEEKIGK